MGIFERDYLELERAMLGDTISVRWAEIRAITGTVGTSDGKPTGEPIIVEGSCTLYLEGELGFIVNHSREDIIAMVEKRQITQ
jgi:hypothetical protein